MKPSGHAQIRANLTERSCDWSKGFRGDIPESETGRQVATPSINVLVQPRLPGATLGATALARNEKVPINQIDTRLVR